MTAHTEIDFDLDNASPAAGAVKKKCHDIGRKIEDELAPKQAVDQQFARWVMLHVQSNPLPICTRPRVLIKAKRT